MLYLDHDSNMALKFILLDTTIESVVVSFHSIGKIGKSRKIKLYCMPMDIFLYSTPWPGVPLVTHRLSFSLWHVFHLLFCHFYLSSRSQRYQHSSVTNQSVFILTRRIFHLKMVLYFSSPNLNVKNMAEWLFLTRSCVWLRVIQLRQSRSWCWGRRESDTAATWAVPCTDPPGLSLSWVFFSQIRQWVVCDMWLDGESEGCRRWPSTTPTTI
jgi:hypothetical protein